MTGSKILLVEDNTDWQDILQEKLRKALPGTSDSEITLIDTFHLAQKALQENSWDLLVSDIGLGSRRDSSELKGKFLVELACKLNIPVIAVSGTPSLDRQDVRDLLIECGAADFFYKQKFRGKEFIDRVQQILLINNKIESQNKGIRVMEQKNMLISLKSEDRSRLIDVLASQATNSFVGTRSYFRDIINRANLPKRWVQEGSDIWTGDANIDARKLINWACAKDINPQDKKYTTLGSILKPVLEEDVGFNNACILAIIIFIYQLYRDPQLLNNLQIRYQIPGESAAISSEISEGSPEFDWRGPTDKIELQSWLRLQTDLLDVGFLRRVVEKATSVCRLELPHKVATGVLIAPNLVLTNYHVLRPTATSTLENNARQTILRFGYFTSTTGSESEGQTFQLASEKPILTHSEDLDYILLQVEDSINHAQDVNPVSWETEEIPQQRQSIFILQHPRGDSMKAAISNGGITGVYSNQGLIQYVSTTYGGSSGSPCFNENWQLVALHHAERSRSFGIIQEGILFSSIYQEIQKHLP